MADALNELSLLMRIEEARRRGAGAILAQAISEREAVTANLEAATRGVSETLAYWRNCLHQRSLDQGLLAGLDLELTARDAARTRAENNLREADARVATTQTLHALHNARLKALAFILERRRAKKTKKLEERTERTLADLFHMTRIG